MRISLALVIALLVGGCAPATPSVEPSSTVDATPTAVPATPAPTATPEPTAAPTPTPAPTPEPWASYKSKRYHYSIKYPPTWIVTRGSARVPDQFDGYGYPYLFVARDVVRGGTASMSLTVAHEIAYNKSHYKAKLVSNKPVKLRGYSGRLLTFNGVDNGLKVQLQRLILGKGQVGYFLTMWGNRDAAVADQALFKKIYKTWRPT